MRSSKTTNKNLLQTKNYASILLSPDPPYAPLNIASTSFPQKINLETKCTILYYAGSKKTNTEIKHASYLNVLATSSNLALL